MRLIQGFLCLFLLGLQGLGSEEIVPEQTVMMPMRDGTELPTDLYFPKNQPDKPPCILLRSPGGRQAASALSYRSLTEEGYLIAIQDTRSATDPDGKTLPYWSDGWGNHQDGFDAVQWLANSPYTNGKIGTVGFSGLGITQLLLAPTSPPALKCQYMGMASSNLYEDAIFPGGQLLKNQVEGWLGLYAKDPQVLQYVCGQQVYNAFWKQFDSPRVAHRVHVAGVHLGGWFDTFIQGTLDGFVARQENGGSGAQGTQKLLIGPWTHLWPLQTQIGDFAIPLPGQKPPFDLSVSRWLDHYLKGIDNGVDKEPAVTYYVMGPFDGSFSSGNVWRQSDSWPIPAVATPFYLTADQKLVAQADPPRFSAQFRYEADARNPVPTCGGRNLFLESGPKDQRAFEKRSDLLVFTSEPLTEDLEVTGRVIAKLFFNSSNQDIDLAMRLCDLYPDGHSILIADGLTRCQLSGEQPQEVILDLWSTSIVFAKGHSIRVLIANSNYPRFEKNFNGCKGPAISKNILHVGNKTPSQLILPLVRRGDLWLNKAL